MTRSHWRMLQAARRTVGERTHLPITGVKWRGLLRNLHNCSTRTRSRIWLGFGTILGNTEVIFRRTYAMPPDSSASMRTSKACVVGSIIPVQVACMQWLRLAHREIGLAPVGGGGVTVRMSLGVAGLLQKQTE